MKLNKNVFLWLIAMSALLACADCENLLVWIAWEAFCAGLAFYGYVRYQDLSKGEK